MDTWPISTRDFGGHTFLGIHDRCGTANFPFDPERGPCLEQVGGEDWNDMIFRLLLPAERAWAWWTPSLVYRRSGLSFAKASQLVQLRDLKTPVVRRSFLSSSALVVVPPASAVQDTILSLAGMDTEFEPDHFWTAPPHLDTWDLNQIATWCKDPTRWGNPASIPEQPADVVVTVFDDQISCALPSDRAPGVQAALAELAQRWGLRIIPGDPSYAWASPRLR
jgi:hypothetical protein